MKQSGPTLVITFVFLYTVGFYTKYDLVPMGKPLPGETLPEVGHINRQGTFAQTQARANQIMYGKPSRVALTR